MATAADCEEEADLAADLLLLWFVVWWLRRSFFWGVPIGVDGVEVEE